MLNDDVVVHNPFCFVFVEAVEPPLHPPAPAAAVAHEDRRRAREEEDDGVQRPAIRPRNGMYTPAEEAAAPARRAPLPTFEPLTVAPLNGDSVSALVAGMAGESMCAICHDVVVAPHVTACSHVFCGECITKALQRRPSARCPECCAEPGKPVYVRKLDALLCAAVEPFLPAEDEAVRSRRKFAWQQMQLEAARKQAPAPALLSEAEAEAARWLAGVIGGPARPAVSCTWRVEYARAPRLVCHSCCLAVPPGMVREEASPSHARQFFHLHCRPAACPAAHARGRLQGLEDLQPADRAAVIEATAAASGDMR